MTRRKGSRLPGGRHHRPRNYLWRVSPASLCLGCGASPARAVRKGDRIGVMVPNCCELAVLYFACIYLGAVIVPINPALSKSEIQFMSEELQALARCGERDLRRVDQRPPPERGALGDGTGSESKRKRPHQIKIDDLEEANDFVSARNGERRRPGCDHVHVRHFGQAQGFGAQAGTHVP